MPGALVILARLLRQGISALALFAAWAATAAAGVTTFNGTLAPGGPKITPVAVISTPNCTGGYGSVGVLFKSFSITVDTSGTYAITEPGSTSGIYVHEGAPDPGAAAINCIAASNSNPINLNASLTAGTVYTVTVFDDTFGQAGFAFSVTVSGPGNIARRCASFTDLDSGDVSCPAVEWIKNRLVTLGCTSTLYCPNDSVTRLQMALFMNRLGKVFEPVFLQASSTTASAAVNTGSVVCATGDYAVTDYPRTASPASVAVYHRGASAVGVETRLVYSLDAGTTWTDWGAIMRAANVANLYASQAPAAVALPVSPGQTIRFGIQASATGTTNDAGCLLSVRFDSRTLGTTPGDERPVADLQPGREPSHGN